MEKVLRVSFCVVVLVCVALGSPSKGKSHAGRTSFETIVAKGIAHSLFSRLQREVNHVAPKAPILPPLPDPDCFGPWHIPLDISIPEFEAVIIGDLNVTSESKLHGFSTISDDLAVIPAIGGIGANWTFALPLLTMEGDTAMDLTLQLGESSLSLVGGGPMEGSSVEDVFLSLHVVFSNAVGNTNMSLRRLEFDLGFKNFYINLGHVTAGEDVVVDWERVSDGIQTYFDTMWNPEVIGIIDDALSCILNFAIGGCRDLLGIPDCLKLDAEQIDAECFVPENLNVANSMGHIGSMDAILATDPFVVCSDSSAPTEDPELTTTTGTTVPTTTKASTTTTTTESTEATTAGVSTMKPMLSILLVVMTTIAYGV